MTEPPKTKDLIVLVPDADMEYAIQALLPRHQALDIRPVTFDVICNAMQVAAQIATTFCVFF